ncbi:MAG TPA: WD40 repeat domain-containing protein [Candidatus Solibacter sp.]|nr:WD40 repeat domain-containing protein [Candidatus Solibacter sp.]
MPREIATIPTPAPAGSFLLARTGKLAGAVCEDRKLRLWTLPEAKLQHALDLGNTPNDLAEISPDGRWLVTGDHHGNAYVWDAASGTQALELGLKPYPGAVAFSYDSRLLALCAMGEPVKVYELATRHVLYELERPIGGSNAVAFSRDSTRLATADGDTVVRIYDVRSGKALARHTDFLQEPFGLDFTIDGKQIVTGGGDKVIVYLDAASGKALRRMDRTAEPPLILRISPDGKSLAAAYMKADNLLEPGPVMIFDAATSRRTSEWMPPSRALGGGWTDDGRLLIATASKDAIHVWQM